MFLKHQIIIESFLNDHVTLKTGVMAAENSALSFQEYIPLENCLFIYLFYCNNISQYYCFERNLSQSKLEIPGTLYLNTVNCKNILCTHSV